MALAPSLLSFSPPGDVLSVREPEPLAAPRGQTVTATIGIVLKPGYHINCDQPADDYLIPFRLTWEAGALRALGVEYPEPKQENYSFSDKPLSVFTGDFEVVTRFAVPATASAGRSVMRGKVRYQACTDKLCLPPKTVAFELPVEIR